MRRREFIAGLGSAAVWPLAARGQQPSLPVIGVLRSAEESAVRSLTAAFHRGLNEQGYVEKRNVNILYRYADTLYDRMPALVADLLSRGVSVIATDGGTGTVAAK